MPNDDQNWLFENLGFGEDANDQYAHDLFWGIYYDDEVNLDMRLQMIDELQAYLETEYGIDFTDTWDWDDFRSWYENA